MCPNNSNASSGMDLGNLAQWAGATATFAAVCVALFKDGVVRWLRMPKLTASIKTEPPDCVKTMLTVMGNVPIAPQGPQGIIGYNTALITSECYYIRLWVENTGKTTANRVQVFATSLLKKTGSSFKPVAGYLPMNLKWADSHEIYAEGLNAKMGRHCDIGHILNPTMRQKFPGEEPPDLQTIRTLLSLDVEAMTYRYNHIIEEGIYQLTLKIAGANCTPVPVTIQIEISGDWFSDEKTMLTNGVSVKIV